MCVYKSISDILDMLIKSYLDTRVDCTWIQHVYRHRTP